MREAKPALLIANRNSRRGHDVAPFVAALERGGLRLRQEPCPSPDTLATLIRSLRDEVGAVLLAGGDGTLHHAAPALLEAGLPLGILPLGTANDLARSLALPDGPDEAAGIILAGATRPIDLGAVNGVPFFNVAHLGLSARITNRLTRATKRRLGPLAYPLVAAGVMLRFPRFHATLTADAGEGREVRTLQVTVGNGRYYGGGAIVHADASIEDGRLHVLSLEPRARWRLLLMARAFTAGEHDRLPEIRNFTCREIHVETRRPRPITADGEPASRTPATFTVLPRALRVFAPPIDAPKIAVP